jgi:DNA-directed RNA polymerase subunit RPC12/RpoP
MQFVPARCPQCGGDLQLDKEKETGFCMHCGSKIVVEEAIKAVKIDNTHMIETWMKMGDLASESQNLKEAYEYYTKIIEVQPNNWEAIYKKGKAAGWQSTLVNVRLIEAATCFAKAIDLAPEDEKEKLKNDSTNEIKRLAFAIISLRADRFIKWPTKDEANGFLGDINTINNAVNQMIKKSGVVVIGYMEPIALKIISSVVAAWSKTILPNYNGNNNHPNKYEFDTFIERIGFCTMVIEEAITLSDDDYEVDIQGYQNLIFLENAAINSCSWKLHFSEWGNNWRKDYQLTETAKQSRKNLISWYNNKILEIKNKKQQREEAENQKKERKVIEEAKKRFDDYWSAHIEEKENLKNEKNWLSDQIISLEKEKNTVTSPLLKEINNINTRIAKLCDDQKSLGLFKGDEKKVLQAQIEDAKKYLAVNTSKLFEVQKPIMVKIESLKKRINDIDNELKKVR